MDKGILYLVPTPIGNLGDMTYRGVELLKSVDLIAAEDTRTSLKLLNHYGIRNKLISYHKFNEAKQTKLMLDALEKGKNIALISDAGTPGISDPAAILVKAVILKGIQVTCLPGATALIPALAASGLDANNFTFVGFLPVKQKDRKALLTSLAGSPHTIVLYESSHRITETLLELIGYFAGRNCVIARELSKLYESFYRGSLEELAANADLETRGEFVILLEGKTKRDISDEDLSELIKQACKKNLPLKELTTQIAQATGINRNRIYKLAIALKEKS
jgi:16S rRNA (cytidine1402-2'-O)-methyltransferase